MIGKFDDFVAISNADMGTEEIEASLLEVVTAYDSFESIFVFVDLFGSSCWKAAKFIELRRSNIRVITGVNIPMLLSFLTKRGRFAPDDLEYEVRKAGIRGIEGG